MNEVDRDIIKARSAIRVDPIELAVEAIEVDISDRKSLKSAWLEIDDAVKSDIKAKWKAIIKRCIQ